MQLEPNDLLLFARVVDEGSFSKAAQRLSVPVSTVSRRITALETALGERLILRTTRKLTVTELGESLLEHARQVQESAEAAGALADNRMLEPGGRLRVTMATDLGLMAPFLAEFLDSYPAIVLEVDVSARFVDLIGENFDVALRLGPLKDDATLAARRVCDLCGGLYASPAYLKKRGTPNEPSALLEHHAVHTQRRTGQPLEWRLQRGKARWEGLPPAKVMGNSPDFVLRMAANGAGIVLSEHGSTESYVKAGQLVRVLAEWEVQPTPLWAVFPGRRLMPARTRAFIDAITAKFGASKKA
ncbi:MAG TPA: LysR family transcriptional regulator [Burkholderiales bacterium]